MLLRSEILLLANKQKQKNFETFGAAHEKKAPAVKPGPQVWEETSNPKLVENRTRIPVSEITYGQPTGA
jgi:hypothetical protein